MANDRPHVLAIDDGPFSKGQPEPVTIVAVMVESPLLVEAVAIGELPVDAEAPTPYLADWIAGLRCYPSVQAVVLGGITIAGLGVIDVTALAAAIGRPVLVVNRRDPSQSHLDAALRSAGFDERLAVVARTPVAVRLDPGPFVAWAGCDRSTAAKIVSAALGKAMLPEALRLAHIIARAVVTGESRGRA